MLLMRTSSFRMRRAPWTRSSRFIPFSLARVSSKPFSASSKVCYSQTDRNRRHGFARGSDGRCVHFKGELPCLVPLWLLHFFGLSLRGEDETGSQRGHGPFSDSLLGVPYRVKDVVKERLHLLKEESGGAHSQLPQHQHLKERVNCPISYY